MTTSSDPELVQRCLAGDRDAWSSLLSRYVDLVYGIARQSGLDDAGSQDVVQGVSIALWKGLSRLRRAERLLPWLVRTARRAAWRLARTRRAAGRRERAVARPEASVGRGPDALEALEDEQAVRAGLAALDERCRRLLRALYFAPEGERGYDAVAESLGIARGSVGPTRGRCLERLREELLRRGMAPEEPVSRPASAASTRRRRGAP